MEIDVSGVFSSVMGYDLMFHEMIGNSMEIGVSGVFHV